MFDNPNDIVSGLKCELHGLVAFAKSNPQGTTAYMVERTILSKVMEIGRLAYSLFLELQAAEHVAVTTVNADGEVFRRHGRRRRLAYSLFGTVEYQQSYYLKDGISFWPLAADLNLPETGQSDLLRQMTDQLAVTMSYEDSTQFLSQYFPVATSTRCVAEQVIDDAVDAPDYYKNRAEAPLIPAEAYILVCSADEKGVPMVNRPRKQEPDAGRTDLTPSHDGRMKMSTAVTVSRHRPFFRTADQVVASLFDKKENPFDKNAPGRPDFKWVWATLKGKQSATEMMALTLARADDINVRHRIALTDGSKPLQAAVDAAVDEYSRILDFVHALGYLWKAGEAQFRAEKRAVRSWVREAALRMLRGETPQIIEELDQWLDEIPDQQHTRWKPIETAACYFQDNLEQMRYDVYLANGWPISTGIVEGVCRHIIKDRCERTGARWTEPGAEAMLNLRSIEHNGDWEKYHQYRRATRSVVLYKQPATITDEADVYMFNATESYATAV